MNLSSAANMMGIAFKDFSDTNDKVSAQNADTLLEEVLDDTVELRVAYGIAYRLDAEYCNQEFANLLSECINTETSSDDYCVQLSQLILRVFCENTGELTKTLMDLIR